MKQIPILILIVRVFFSTWMKKKKTYNPLKKKGKGYKYTLNNLNA